MPNRISASVTELMKTNPSAHALVAHLAESVVPRVISSQRASARSTTVPGPGSGDIPARPRPTPIGHQRLVPGSAPAALLDREPRIVSGLARRPRHRERIYEPVGGQLGGLTDARTAKIQPVGRKRTRRQAPEDTSELIAAIDLRDQQRQRVRRAARQTALIPPECRAASAPRWRSISFSTSVGAAAGALEGGAAPSRTQRSMSRQQAVRHE